LKGLVGLGGKKKKVGKTKLKTKRESGHPVKTPPKPVERGHKAAKTKLQNPGVASTAGEKKQKRNRRKQN